MGRLGIEGGQACRATPHNGLTGLLGVLGQKNEPSVHEGQPLKLARMIRVGPCRDRLVYLAIRICSCRVLFRVIRVVHFRLAPFGGKARHKGNET